MDLTPDERKSTWSGLMVPVSALLIGLCVGSGYGWSVFVRPLMAQHGWSQTQVTLTYSFCLFSQGLAYLLTGYLADRHPRTIAVVGGTIFGAAFILTGLFAHFGCLILMYLSYGVIGGFASGLPYLAGLSAAVKWFPRHCGLISGISVMGAGLGAFFVGLFTPQLIICFGPGMTLMGMGIIFLLVCGGLGFAIRNPPEFKQLSVGVSKRKTILPWDVLKQGKFWARWLRIYGRANLGRVYGPILFAQSIAQRTSFISSRASVVWALLQSHGVAPLSP